MSDPRSSTVRSSSALAPTSFSSDSGSVRPRNRRLLSALDNDTNRRHVSSSPPRDRSTGRSSSNGLLSALNTSFSRSASPQPAPRSGTSPSRANLTEFFNDSLSQSWASVQGLASSLLSGDDGHSNSVRSNPASRSASRPRLWGRDNTTNSLSRKQSWGPAPPNDNPGLNDVATGSLMEREAALKAAKKASILESHDGVNGGLDVVGRHKRRNSDELTAPQTEVQEYLVYVHKVLPSDTYAGLILRYQCREDAFRKANGLWTRDSVQMRKWLMIPVDACEIRGRPCDPPAWHNNHGIDLLAPTPAVEDDPWSLTQRHGDDFFSQPGNSVPSEPKPSEEEEKPWTHVRWVRIDAFQDPVEIARVARKAMGYFPPRRKKSSRTISTFSTPRQSLDLPSNAPASVEGFSSRRQSSLSSRPLSSSFSSPGRSLNDGSERLPTWMRQPGGVGSMGKNSRAPGPDKDYLTSWTKKHMPGLNLEGPSMSIMGSETARFGFKSEQSGIVENHHGEGHDTNATTTQGTNGLDKAAAAVETWLRGALARHPGTPLGGPRGRPGGEGDLIELTDTGSDDGKMSGREMPADPNNYFSAFGSVGSSSRSAGDGAVRGRTMTSGSKNRKDE